MRRGLPLTSKWKTHVQDSFVDHEFGAHGQFSLLRIYVLANGKRKNLYEVNVDKQSGKIEDFLDIRRAVPIDTR